MRTGSPLSEEKDTTSSPARPAMVASERERPVAQHQLPKTMPDAGKLAFAWGFALFKV